MEMLKRPLLIASALAFLASAFPAFPQPLAVTGAVHDELGRALAGAEVLLFATEPAFSTLARLASGAEAPPPRLATTSGTDGRFELQVPEPGMWRVELRTAGRVAVEQALRPLLEPQELAAAVLRPDVGTKVTVRDPKNRPIPQAKVELLAFWGRTELWGIGWKAADRRGETGSDGSARLPAAANESLGVKAQAKGFLPAMRYDLDKSISKISLAVAVERPLRILDPAGAPAAGVLVVSGESSGVAVTGADGGCLVAVGAQGTTEFRFVAADGRAGRGEVGPPERGERRPPSFRLEAPQALRGLVRYGDSGAPAAGALVWSETDPASFVRAGRDGSFRLTLFLPHPEQFVIAAEAGYFPAQNRATELSGGGEPLVLEPKTAIYGRVVDEAGAPLAGAQAALAQQISVRMRRPNFGSQGAGQEASSTGEDGRFRLAAVANELYRLEVTLEGYVPWEKEVSPGNKALRVVMSRGRTVFGRVVGADEQPVAGGRLTLVKAEATQGFVFFSPGRSVPPAPLGSTSDEQGRFRFERVGAGIYHVDTVAPKHAPFRLLAVEIPKGSGQKDLGTLRLEEGVSLSGRVIDATGAPVAGAAVKLEGRAWQAGEDGAASEQKAMMRRFQRVTRMGTAAPEATPEEVRSDAEGRFTVEGLALGERVTLVAEREGYAPARIPAVEAPSQAPLILVLERQASVAGVVVDESGKPVAGAMVTVAESDSGQARGFSRMVISGGGFAASEVQPTDETGRFERQDVRPGRVKVEAQAEGFVAYDQWVEVPPGARVEGVRLVLARGATVLGRVTTDEGAPVATAFVTKTAPDFSSSVSQDSEIDEDGHYRISGVAPGEWFFECFVISSQKRQRQRLLVAPGTNTLDFVINSGSGNAVSGRVIDGSGAPVGAALVMLQESGRMSPPPETSLADGSFLLEDVANGLYTVRVMREGFVMVDAELRVEVAGSAVDGLVVEMYSGGRIEGRVVGLEPRRLPGVSIELGGAGMRFGSTGVGVDSEGTFLMPNHPPGRYTLVATDGAGGRTVEASAVLAEGEESVFVELDFASGLTLSGSVKVGGEPAADAELALSGLDVSSNTSARTNHQGRFEVAGLEAGRYRVTISVPGSSTPRHEEIELSGDDEVSFDFEAGSVLGRVVEASTGRPVAGARLVLLSPDDGAANDHFVGGGDLSDSQGAFELGGVSTGQFRLRATKAGYVAAERALEVRDGERESVVLELAPGAELVLWLSNALGGTPDWVQVVALDAEGRSVLSDTLFTDQNGEVRISRLPPGRFTLLVGTFNTTFVEFEANVPSPRLRVSLPMGSQLMVEVPALSGEATRAKLSLFDPSGRPFRSAAGGQAQSEWSVSGGSARVTGVRPGIWRLVVTTGDGRSWETSAEAPATGGIVPVRVE